MLSDRLHGKEAVRCSQLHSHSSPFLLMGFDATLHPVCSPDRCVKTVVCQFRPASQRYNAHFKLKIASSVIGDGSVSVCAPLHFELP